MSDIKVAISKQSRDKNRKSAGKWSSLAKYCGRDGRPRLTCNNLIHSYPVYESVVGVKASISYSLMGFHLLAYGTWFAQNTCNCETSWSCSSTSAERKVVLRCLEYLCHLSMEAIGPEVRAEAAGWSWKASEAGRSSLGPERFSPLLCLDGSWNPSISVVLPQHPPPTSNVQIRVCQTQSLVLHCSCSVQICPLLRLLRKPWSEVVARLSSLRLRFVVAAAPRWADLTIHWSLFEASTTLQSSQCHPTHVIRETFWPYDTCGKHVWQARQARGKQNPAKTKCLLKGYMRLWNASFRRFCRLACQQTTRYYQNSQKLNLVRAIVVPAGDSWSGTLVLVQ